MSNIGLSVMSLAVLVWCSLAMYVSYCLMQVKRISDADRNLAISGMSIGAIFIIMFLIYAVYRVKSTQQSASQGLVVGFQWYDAVVLFFLLGWCGVSIAISAIFLTYQDRERIEKRLNISEGDRNAAIANIVFSIVMLIQYISYLIVQQQLPSWCQEFALFKKKQRESMRALLDAEEGETPKKRQESTGSGGSQQIIVLPGGLQLEQLRKKKKDSFSIDDDGDY